MKEILLKDVEAGMVTGAPVKTKSGQTLADANTTLSNQLIARFTFYHVQSVVIEDTVEEKTAEPTVFAGYSYQGPAALRHPVQTLFHS